MAATSVGRTAEQPLRRKDGAETSPERAKVRAEDPKPKAETGRKAPVVYYLSRNGHLEHPHFMEVTLSSADGLYLRDVVNRLNDLRGKGMASMYSWSSKRSYKNGFVWQDLSDGDFIPPVHGHEYVLKGSELLRRAFTSSQDTSFSGSVVSSACSGKSLDVTKSDRGPSGGINEYKVYKAGATADASGMAADASTQTEDRRQCRRAQTRDGRARGDAPKAEEEIANPRTELGRDEISSPPPSSSPETLLKADGRVAACDGPALDANPPAEAPHTGRGRARASAVLMHIFSCGFSSLKDHHGFSLMSQYRARLPRRRGLGASGRTGKEADAPADGATIPTVRSENREFYSGSLVEAKKKAADPAGELAAMKRSSSFNADRWTRMDAAEKAADGARAKCIPRRSAKALLITGPDGRKKGSGSRHSSYGAERAGDG